MHVTSSEKTAMGTSSPYVVVDFNSQRKRTQTAARNLNPTWNEALEFTVGGPSPAFRDTLEVDVYHDKNYGPTRRHNHLGRVRLSSGQFVKKGEEALIYFPLEKKYLLSWIPGEIGLKVYYSDEAPPLPPPPLETVPEEGVAGEDKKDESPAVEKGPAKEEEEAGKDQVGEGPPLATAEDPQPPPASPARDPPPPPASPARDLTPLPPPQSPATDPQPPQFPVMERMATSVCESIPETRYVGGGGGGGGGGGMQPSPIN